MKQNKIFRNQTVVNIGAASLLSVVSLAAQAADPAAANANGVMTFPNVEVVTAPPSSVSAEAPQAPQSAEGFKAFINPTTKQLVQPTKRAAAALDAAANRTQSKTSPIQAATTQALQQSPAFAGAHGGIGMTLDSSHMSYAVAHRTPEGKLDTDCIPGQEAATSFIKNTDSGEHQAKAKGEALR